MLITEFFENQEIFITGGSGFLGKALIEKLLRDCHKIRKIYVLLREKKQKSCEERLRDIINSSLFDRVRVEQPESIKKLVAIPGDCRELGLGICASDLDLLKNVNIIYHSAATVKFDEELRDAILMNTRGTHELVKLALTMKQLKVLMHISTTYCNPDKHVVEERIYPAFADWRTTIKLAETYDTEILNVLGAKYSCHQPNTYTFTKGLGEQIINEYRQKLPVMILRPSIVVSSHIEPVPGWIDNFNGPLGMLVGCGIGIMRSSYADRNQISDFVPVDIVVRTIIIATYTKVMENNELQNNEECAVVNCAAAAIRSITIQELLDIGTKTILDNPFEKTLWVPGGGVTMCPVVNWIRVFTYQILMACVFDTIFRLTNRKPFLLKLQRRIFSANMSLHYFMSNSWQFKIEKLIALDGKVPDEETDKFKFMQFKTLDYDEFFRAAIRGAKVYLLKESAESSQAAKTRMTIYKILHYSIQVIVGFLFVRFLANILYGKILELF